MWSSVHASLIKKEKQTRNKCNAIFAVFCGSFLPHFCWQFLCHIQLKYFTLFTHGH